MHKEHNALTLKICAQCGKEYMPQDYRHQSPRYKFCSKTCQRKYHSEHKRQSIGGYDRVCVICGKAFHTFQFQKKTCSQECSEKRAYAMHHPQLKHETHTGTCLHCGKTFETNSGTKKYCSDACRKASYNKNSCVPSSKKVTFHLTCAQCGKPFDFIGNEHMSPKFMPKTCSKECAKERERAQNRKYNAKKRLRHRIAVMKEFEVVCSKDASKREHVAFSETRICKECGKEFVAHNPRKQFCCWEHANSFNFKKRHPKVNFHKKCLVCGTEFDTNQARKMFCSVTCKKRHELEEYHKLHPVQALTKSCKHCGKEFTTSNRYVLYCSKECKEKHHIEHPELNAYKPKEPPKPRECEKCHKIFTPSKNHPNARFCSNECRNHSTYVKAVIKPRVCKWCGETFMPSRSHQNANCCSNKCRSKYKYFGYKSEVQVAFERAGRVHMNKCKPHASIPQTKRVCKHCGKEFMPEKIGQLYCSAECKTEHNAKHKVAHEVVCKVCGKTFMTTHKRRTTCSNECAYINRSRYGQVNGKKYDHRKTASVVEIRTCVVCGNEFETHLASQRFCTPECADVYHSTRHRLANDKHLEGEQLINAIADTLLKRRNRKHIQCIEHDHSECRDHSESNSIRHGTCPHCGKEFEYVYRGSNKIYCSTTCAKRAEKRRYYERHHEDIAKAKLARDILRAEKREEYLKAKEAKRLSRILTKRCPVCGKVFTTTNSLKKFCDEHCAKVSLVVRKTLNMPSGDFTYEEFQEAFKKYEAISATKSIEEKRKRAEERNKWLIEHREEFEQKRQARKLARQELMKKKRLEKAAAERDYFNRIILPTLLATGKKIEKHVCEYCGNEYYEAALENGHKRKHHYCSDACYGYHMQLMRNGNDWNTKKEKKNNVIVTTWRKDNRTYKTTIKRHIEESDEDLDNSYDTLTDNYISGINFN